MYNFCPPWGCHVSLLHSFYSENYVERNTLQLLHRVGALGWNTVRKKEEFFYSYLATACLNKKIHYIIKYCSAKKKRNKESTYDTAHNLLFLNGIAINVDILLVETINGLIVYHGSYP